jgi:hypothetical protein
MSKKTQNRVSTLLNLAMAASAVIAISPFAVAQLVLDDFSTGPYQKTLSSGANTNIQYGSMVGDSRETTLNVCPPEQCNPRPQVVSQDGSMVGDSRETALNVCPPEQCNPRPQVVSQDGSMVGDSRETALNVCPPEQCNPRPQVVSQDGNAGGFKQSVSFHIMGKTKSSPAALVYSSGYKTDGYLDVFYGKSTPLNLDLASTYDRIRLNFDGAQFVNFNIVIYTNGLYSASGCNLADHTDGKPFSVDFPFADFTPGKGTAGADFRNLTQIALLFANSEGRHSSEDFAVTSVQAIPTGVPAADITCHGYGK